MVSRDETNVWIATYMMASKKHGVVYTGVTSQLPGRVQRYRDGTIAGFTKRHDAKRLVWFETSESIVAAIQREKTIKGWPRQWKLNLIERDNPDWDDLYPTLFGSSGPDRWPEIAPSP